MDANRTKLQLTHRHGSLLGLGTLAGPAGQLDLASHYAGTLALKQVALAPLQALAVSATAARIAKGKLDASGQLRLDWGKASNVHIEPAPLGISDFALEPQAKGLAVPVAWRQLDVGITRLDLAARNAQLDKVTANGLQIDAVRERNNRIDLANLFASKHTASASNDEGPAWRWSIARLGLEQGSLRGSRIDLRCGEGTPRVHLGGLVLDAFHARVIVNSNGRLDLSDVTSVGEQAPVS